MSESRTRGYNADLSLKRTTDQWSMATYLKPGVGRTTLCEKTTTTGSRTPSPGTRPSAHESPDHWDKISVDPGHSFRTLV
jgi:hypothetical protein